MRGMGKADRISGCFWLVFGLIVSLASHQLGLGSLRRPGPGFLFFWAGIFLGVLSLITLIRAEDDDREGGAVEAIWRGKNIPKVVLVTVSLFLYAVFMEKLGFVPVTVLLFLFLLGWVEKRRWLFTISATLIVTMAAYLIFEILLQSQLPEGILGFLRF